MTAETGRWRRGRDETRWRAEGRGEGRTDEAGTKRGGVRRDGESGGKEYRRLQRQRRGMERWRVQGKEGNECGESQGRNNEDGGIEKVKEGNVEGMWRVRTKGGLGKERVRGGKRELLWRKGDDETRRVKGQWRVPCEVRARKSGGK